MKITSIKTKEEAINFLENKRGFTIKNLSKTPFNICDEELNTFMSETELRKVCVRYRNE